MDAFLRREMQVKHVFILGFLLLSQVGLAERYWVFGDSNIREEGVAVPVFFGERTSAELKRLPFRTEGGIVKVDSAKPLKVHFFIPPTSTPEERKAWVSKIQRSLKERYGEVKVVAQEPPSFPRRRDRKVTLQTGFAKALVSTLYFTQIATGNTPLGWGQAAFASTLDVGTSYFVENIIEFKEDFEIPWGKDLAPVKWFNKNDFVKGILVNHGFGLFASTGFGLMAWMNDPTLDAPLSAEFFANYLGIMGLLDTPFNALGEMWGVRNLAKKGFITKNQEIWMYQMLSFQIQLNYLLFGSQNWKFLPFSLGTSWATRAGLAAAGKLLPTKDNRVWVLHPDLDETQRTAIVYDQRLDGALPRDLLKEPGTFTELMEDREIQANRPVPCNWFARLAGRK